MNERIEIRPARGLNFLKMIGLMVVMVAACGFMLIDADSVLLKAIGAFGVVFFGGGGLFALWSMSRTPWTFALAPDALEIRVEDFIARIPWRDIEAVGLIRFAGQAMPSIRLATYDNYLASLSPEATKAFEKRWAAMKWMSRATMILTFEPRLAGHAAASSLVDAMRANRNFTNGYDISFSWSQIDRPAGEFVPFLEREWQARRQ